MTDEGNSQYPQGLTEFEERLRSELADVATLTRKPMESLDGAFMVALEPRNIHSLPIAWTWMGDLTLELGNHQGGRWELVPTDDDVLFLEDLVESVIAGRATETFAFHRSSVKVTLQSGKVAEEVGYSGCLIFALPLPGWRHWGRRTQYEPYFATER